MTGEQKEALIKEAFKALQNPYPRDAIHVYAAAVLTDIGEIYSASNYHSDTHSLTLHAEQSALVHAAAHGRDKIVAIAVTSKEQLEKGEFTPPCHMCKQILWENRLRSGLPMEIILANSHGETKEVNLDALMPLPWPPQRA